VEGKFTLPRLSYKDMFFGEGGMFAWFSQVSTAFMKNPIAPNE